MNEVVKEQKKKLIVDVTASLTVLTPPQFDGECTICKSWRKLLPWLYVDSDNCWGPVCSSCGKQLLILLLRRRLPSIFSEADLMDVLFSVGVEGKEAQLTAVDLEKEGIILRNTRGFSWPGEGPIEPLFIPIGAGLRKAHKHQQLTGEQVFKRCVKLSVELLEEKKH